MSCDLLNEQPVKNLGLHANAKLFLTSVLTGQKSPGFTKGWWGHDYQLMCKKNNRSWNTRVCVCGQELYEKSLVRVEDGCLPADLLEVRTFLEVPQVNTFTPQQTAGAQFISHLFTFFAAFRIC